MSDQTQNKPVFQCATARTLKWYVVLERLHEAAGTKGLPESSQIVGIADMLADNLAQTRGVDFPADVAPEWYGLREFWAVAETSADYALIWNKALELLTVDILAEWNEQVSASLMSALRAPDELQPGSPADEDLPPNS